MNALNENVVKQIENNFDKAESDPHINNIFITGSGKAFVAGADIKFFIDNIRANTIDNIVSFTKYCQDVFEKIDKSRKKVVAVLNGLALGGGLELALCADVILAAPKAVMAFPETGIGIYPGLGGTQRTQKRIGKEHTKYLIFTGDFISANDALKTGLVDKVLPLKDLTEIMIGNEEIPQADKTPPDEKFTAIGKFFSKYSCGNTLASDDELSAKLLKRISQKAPLAIRTAEKLIDEAAGCESELEHLKMIFSTADALLGLSSMGKKTEFQGK
jgi:enoyl-CoA hydratase/3-hydroxyacyl-CoA dehydrogenase